MRHAETYRNSQIPADSTKGLFYADECNRTACDNRPATWFNIGTHAYYCRACADAIDWRKGHGVTRLCYEVDHDLSVKEMDAYNEKYMQARLDDDKRLDGRPNMQSIPTESRMSVQEARIAALDAVYGNPGDALNPRVYSYFDIQGLDSRAIRIRRVDESMSVKRGRVDRRKNMTPEQEAAVKELLAESERQEKERKRLANERYMAELREQAERERPMVEAAAAKQARKNAKRLANIKR